MDNELTPIIMDLIVNSGNSRSLAMEAIFAAKEGDSDKAAALLDECDDYLNRAHNTQTSLLTREASGEATNVTLLLVHAQDHLMNAITIRDLAKELVDLHKKIS